MPPLPGPPIEPTPAEKFFGLAARPFSLTPDLRFAYHSRSHTHALDEVTTALRRREGLIVVTGAVGSGKTMLCRSMLESFESRTFLSVILDPGLEVEDLLRTVLTDFGIMSASDAPPSGPMSEVTRHQYVSTLQQFLATLIPLQAHAVIMIDEAQRLNPRVLEEIRLLSNFETDEAKLLQIVLVGQPELADVLRTPLMLQLNQRVARRCVLQPLTESEVGDYIDRRITVAASPAALSGDAEAPPPDLTQVARFSPEAVKTVAGVSGGIPRLVNTLCDRALDVAYERSIRTIDPDAVLAAAERLHLDVPSDVAPPGSRRKVWIAAALVAVLALAAAAWWAFGPRERAAATLDAPAAAPTAAPRTPVADAAPPAPAQAAPAAPAPATPPAAEAAPVGTSASAPPPQAPAGSAQPTPPAPGRFQVAVSSFRTESRARDVASAIAAIDVPVSVRFDEAGGWYRVVAGPFADRDAALAGQETLSRAGYNDTVVSPVAAAPR
ncbi:MAG: AAA family ATPase [Vicinamibacterales bacterium]